MRQEKEVHKNSQKKEKARKDELAKKQGDALGPIPKDKLMDVTKEKRSGISEEDAIGIKKKQDKSAEEVLNAESLKIELDEKGKLAQDYYDRLIRTQAEFENYKKRVDKESLEFRTYANAQLVKELLRILDDFQNALSIKEEGSNKELLKGFELIYRNFFGVLEKEGLSIINPVDEKFDPWKHEAVEMVPTKKHPEHTVMSVIQPGYKLKDKILRPAKVRVATEFKEEKIEEEEKDNSENEKKENDDQRR